VRVSWTPKLPPQARTVTGSWPGGVDAGMVTLTPKWPVASTGAVTAWTPANSCGPGKAFDRMVIEEQGGFDGSYPLTRTTEPAGTLPGSRVRVWPIAPLVETGAAGVGGGGVGLPVILAVAVAPGEGVELTVGAETVSGPQAARQSAATAAAMEEGRAMVTGESS
jgi:hypothetical protein